MAQKVDDRPAPFAPLRAGSERRGHGTTPYEWGFGPTCMYEKAPFMGRCNVAQCQGAAHPLCEQPWAVCTPKPTSG